MARRLGAKPVAVAENDGSFEGWPQRVAEHVGSRTKAVIVASPSNPSGATLSADEARELVEVCRLNGLRLICDEAYAEFRFAGECSKVPADFDRDRETVVQIRSASKSWALCGWRLGWTVADTRLAARIAAVHAALFNPAPGPTQAALQRLPDVPHAYLDAASAEVHRRLSDLAAALQADGLPAAPPAGGFYLWLDGQPLMDRYGADGLEQLCVSIANRFGVGLWPGSDFGSAGHLRIAVTAPADATWERSRDRLRSALSPLSAAEV
jgi:aspartate aminotransferase